MTAVHNPATPHLQPIPGGLQPGNIVHVTGTYTPGAASLIVKLQSGPSGDPADEIGLCIYGRVKEGQLGRNSFTRMAGWGQEELSHGVAGLTPGVPFELTILNDPQCFKIAYNGQHLCEFFHRLNPAGLNYLQIGSLPGDLSLSCVWVEQPNSMATASIQQPNYGPAPPPYSASAPHGSSLPYNPNPQQGYAPPPGMMPAGQAQYQNQQYPTHQAGKSKGLGGIIGGVAGTLGATSLLNKATNLIGGKSSASYPQHGGGYPQHGGGYPQHGGGYPQHGGGYPQHGGGYPPYGGSGYPSGGGGPW